MTIEAAKTARELVNTQDFGVLSTLSLKLGGFPLGSVVPYCIDGEGCLIILISTIAEHTKNINNDSRCSITITKDSDDVQANGRLCIIGNMEITRDEASSERYYNHFPQSRSYSQAHDFFFYRLVPTAIRYIKGFGSIHWLDLEDFQLSNPFHAKGEDKIIAHMNEDHSASLRDYCTNLKELALTESDTVRMVGIDSEGFDVFVNSKKVRFQFDEPVLNALEAREALVALAKKTKR